METEKEEEEINSIKILIENIFSFAINYLKIKLKRENAYKERV